MKLCLTAQDSYLLALPPFHVFLIPIQHAIPLRTGCASYIMPRYEPQLFVKTIAEFRISRTVMVPPILTSLSKAKFATKDTLRSLRRIYVGGSCAKAEMQQNFYEKLSPTARIEHAYGMTETGWAATTCKDRKRDYTDSVGAPLPGTELR
jgi:acyl-coenzyme A synthetase/AMP-(fatty) acid ligase